MHQDPPAGLSTHTPGASSSARPLRAARNNRTATTDSGKKSPTATLGKGKGRSKGISKNNDKGKGNGKDSGKGKGKVVDVVVELPLTLFRTCHSLVERWRQASLCRPSATGSSSSVNTRHLMNHIGLLPTELLCAIFSLATEPPTRIQHIKDGDGPAKGGASPLRNWYMCDQRSTLRRVCKSWNMTVLGMAKELYLQIDRETVEAFLVASLAQTRSMQTGTRARANAAQRPAMGLMLDTDDDGNDDDDDGDGEDSSDDEGILRLFSRRNAPRVHSPQQVWPDRIENTLHLLNNMDSMQELGFDVDSHPRLYEKIRQEVWSMAKTYNQTFIGISALCMANPSYISATKPKVAPHTTSLKTPLSSASTMPINRAEFERSRQESGISEDRLLIWTCPPSITSLHIRGDWEYKSSSTPTAVVASSSQPFNSTGFAPSTFLQPSATSAHNVDASVGQLPVRSKSDLMLDQFLGAAVPSSLQKFSVSKSLSFGISGLLLLPKGLQVLEILECPRVTSGALMIGFNHLKSLTSLTLCSNLLFTDAGTIYALDQLEHLERLCYIFPCEPIQPVWQDLFRFCHSCELFHRRNYVYCFKRLLHMPQLPNRITELVFQMNDLKLRRERVESFAWVKHSMECTAKTEYLLMLHSSPGSVEDFNSNMDAAAFVDGYGHEARLAPTNQPSPPRSNDLVGLTTDLNRQWSSYNIVPESWPRLSVNAQGWWPENLQTLDLSMTLVARNRFDVPPQLASLTIAYPLEPNEIRGTEQTYRDGGGQDSNRRGNTILSAKRDAANLDSYPSGNGDEEMQDNARKWFPDSLRHLEIQGLPYHASCELMTDRDRKMVSWMAYSERMLTRLPMAAMNVTCRGSDVGPSNSTVNHVGDKIRTGSSEGDLRDQRRGERAGQLETLDVSLFHVPTLEVLDKVADRLRNSLLKLKVRLLIPHRIQAVDKIHTTIKKARMAATTGNGSTGSGHNGGNFGAINGSGNSMADPSAGMVSVAMANLTATEAESLAAELKTFMPKVETLPFQTLRNTAPSIPKRDYQGAIDTLTTFGKSLLKLESFEVFVNGYHHDSCLEATVDKPEVKRDGGKSRAKHAFQKQAVSLPTRSLPARRAAAATRSTRSAVELAPSAPSSGVEVAAESRAKGKKRKMADENDQDDLRDTLSTTSQRTMLAETTQMLQNARNALLAPIGWAEPKIQLWENACCGERCMAYK